MKLYKFQYCKLKNWITFIPTVGIQVNNLMYGEKNIELTADILIWHFRWLFLADKEREE